MSRHYVIDAESYLILARTGHPAERHTVVRDDAVGLSAARRIARKLRDEFPKATVDIFLCDNASRILVA